MSLKLVKFLYIFDAIVQIAFDTVFNHQEYWKHHGEQNFSAWNFGYDMHSEIIMVGFKNPYFASMEEIHWNVGWSDSCKRCGLKESPFSYQAWYRYHAWYQKGNSSRTVGCVKYNLYNCITIDIQQFLLLLQDSSPFLSSRGAPSKGDLFLDLRTFQVHPIRGASFFFSRRAFEYG